MAESQTVRGLPAIMTLTETLKQLKKLGTAKVRAVAPIWINYMVSRG